MTATGIPSHAIIAIRVGEMEQKLDNMINKIDNIMVEVPELVADLVIKKCSDIKGAAAVTKEDVIGIMHQVLPQYLMHKTANNNNDDDNINNDDNINTPAFRYFNWSNGSQHCVPDEFKFPSNNNTKTMFELWYRGNPSQGINPYRFIQPSDLFNKPCHYSLTRAKCLMNYLHNIAVQNNLINIPSDYNKLPIQEFNQCFDSCFERLCEVIDPNGNGLKLAKNSYITVAKKLT